MTEQDVERVAMRIQRARGVYNERPTDFDIAMAKAAIASMPNNHEKEAIEAIDFVTKGSIGAGDDPVGFCIAAFVAQAEKLAKHEKALAVARELLKDIEVQAGTFAEGLNNPEFKWFLSLERMAHSAQSQIDEIVGK